jgi:asparagine synthase (glutamine-hydrolysing)
MIPTFLLTQLIGKHCKVVLGGDGGDELFGGYRAYQGAILQDAMRKVLPRPVRSLVATLAEEVLPVGFRNRNGIIGLRESLADGAARMGHMFSSMQRTSIVPALRELGSSEPSFYWKRDLVEPQRGVPGAFMASDFRSYLPEDILVKVDRASMANSLEVRAPFLDVRIIEFAFRCVPNRMRVTRKERKILLKRLAERILPADFDADRKQGFSIPLAEWTTPAYRAHWCDTFESLFSHVFDFRAIRRLMREEHAGSVSRSFGLLVLMHWMHAWGMSVD